MRNAVVGGLAVVALAGCGVPQAEHDKVVAERDELKGRAAKLENEVAMLEKKLRSMDSRSRMPPKRQGPSEEKVNQWLEEAGITRDSKLSATIRTNQGAIECVLYPDKAPLTVANFVGLAEGTKEWKDPANGQMVKRKLYDGTKFHRVIKNFMIQGGDPLGTGRGGPGYRFEDEVDNGLSFDTKGLLAMANAGPGTNGSQFFITDSLPAHLNGKHTIFGKCELPVVRDIISVPVKGSTPIEDVIIETIAIARK
jgi:peptidyl-prolyl cis-trans isomerase A (cyclophilin A)